MIARTLLALLGLITTALSAEPRAGTFPSESLKVGKDEREYRLVVRDNVDLKQPAPLVFAFHGFLIDSKDVMPRYTKLKFPVMIIHGDKDNIISVSTARENRDKYQKEGHEVKYVEVAGLTHWWATEKGINDEIWEFFAEHPRDKK